MPRSILALVWISGIAFMGMSRFLVRKVYASKNKPRARTEEVRRVLIYGAGQAGELLLRNIENTRQLGLNVIGFIDDDTTKTGKRIHNKRILGNGEIIGELIDEYGIQDIIFSIPSLSGPEIREKLDFIRSRTHKLITIKIMPGLTDLVDDRIQISPIRPIEISDLLKRPPVQLDKSVVERLIGGKSVMVAGGGGSIGKELCRQIAVFKPEHLIVLDRNEFNIYQIEMEFLNEFPSLKMTFIVADGCDRNLMQNIFQRFKPAIVFNAAAYKHVPLMEISPWSAVKNNLLSAMVLEELSMKYGVERFILISTDKAVRPTSVMGATKRICELISLYNHNKNSTKFISVRFGNVLGSSGSVIPKFQKQIESGGPVTVTHTQITRYFMLISEAVELVLHAAAIGESGNIYVLDMGEPIKIAELARLMIELSGLKVGEDVKIVYTGLRPGEKLYESLYFEGRERATDVPNLLILKPDTTFPDDMLGKVRNIVDNIHKLNHFELRAEIKKLVPEYEPNLSKELLN